MPAGAELDTDTSEEDSREEWDKKECGDWSCCPTLPLRVGPTWAEVHTTAKERDALEKNAPTWEDLSSKQVPKNTEEQDSDWDKDDCGPAESQFEDAAIVAEVDREDAMDESPAEAPPVQDISEASVGPGSQDVVQIHAGRTTWNRRANPHVQVHNSETGFSYSGSPGQQWATLTKCPLCEDSLKS